MKKYRLYKDDIDYLGVERKLYFVDDAKETHTFDSKEEAIANFPTVKSEEELKEEWGIVIEEFEKEEANEYLSFCATFTTSPEEAKDFLEWVSVDAKLKDPEIDPFDNNSEPCVDDICAQIEHAIDCGTITDEVELIDMYVVNPENHPYYMGLKALILLQ
jgi:hypothetical protein